MKMLKRIKLKALLSRKHYSSSSSNFGYHRYQRLVPLVNSNHDEACHQVSHHHHHLNLLKSLYKLSPLRCMRATAPTNRQGTPTGGDGGGGGTCLGSSGKGYSVTLSNAKGGRVVVPRDVHKGSCAVYVGPEHKRFVMKTCYLEHPVFGALLRRSEEEFGFEYDGGLTIPCSVSVFEYVLRLIKDKHPSVDAMNRLLQSIESHRSEF